MSRSYKEDLRRRILRAAFIEFGKRGYDRANLDDVARSLGISRGTIYIYFKSKQNIFEAISTQMLQRFRRLMKHHEWTRGDIAATARSFYKESKVNDPRGSEKMTVEILAEASRNRELRKQRLTINKKMQRMIADAIQSEIRTRPRTGKELREIALGAIALYNGLDMLRALGYSEKEAENAWTRTISMITRSEMRRMENKT